MKQPILEDIADISPMFIFIWAVLVVFIGAFMRNFWPSYILEVVGLTVIFLLMIDHIPRSCL